MTAIRDRLLACADECAKCAPELREAAAALSVPEGDMARALEWVRAMVGDNAGSRMHLPAIEEAIAAYDPERAGAFSGKLSGREAVATVTYSDGMRTIVNVEREGLPAGTKLYTTPQPGDGVVVPRWLLEQVYGMAREGCEAPTVGYRWCERIDSIMHGAEPESEYAAWARPLPAKFPAAPSAKGVA